jgi:CheY-like chemotaxis protein
LQDPSTAHVSRVGAARGTDDWLSVAQGLAPLGFDEFRDAVCIHRHGRLLYASPAVSRVLGLDDPDVLIGGTVVDWVHPRDRARVETALHLASEDAESHATTATLTAPGGRSTIIELTALTAGDRTPPFEILYLRSLHLVAAPNGEDEPYMATREGPLAEKGAHRTGVLICDDEARLGTLTAGLLSEYGFDPVTVGTGEDAIVALSKKDSAIDIVLLDVNLSHGKPAREVLATIEAGGNRERVLLTSGLAEEDVDPKLMTHASVAGYVAKPYGVEQLVQSIRKALGPPGT